MSTPDEIEGVYVDGVEAVARAGALLSPDDWGLPVCGSWTATETARHVAAVAGWYHDWLDRAIAGELSRPFPAESIDAETAESLDTHRDLDGPAAVDLFVGSASSYFERARTHWDLPFSYPFGTVTVGLHAGVAAAEWHLHAWDLTGALDQRHVPDDPRSLLIAAGRCVAASEGGLKASVIRRMLPLGARRAPWETMLRRSGRR